MTHWGWKLVMISVVCGWADAAAAQPVGEAAVGPLVKAELTLSGPGLAMQMTQFEGEDDDGQLRELSFSNAMLVAGPVIGVNFGFAPNERLRWGLRAAAQGAAVLAGEQNIPATDFDALLRLAVGPTLGVRCAPRSPFELEFGLGLAAQMVAGSQVSIGDSQNGYPLGAIQYGVDALARGIWRPWGARSPVGFQAGLDFGWALTGAERTTTQGVQVMPEVGVVVGL